MKLQNIIIMMGPPGSGKGTQGEKIATYLNYGYFSMGAALREYGKKNTELAQRIKNKIDQGVIVADADIRELFLDKVNEMSEYKGLILDGYPRTMGQISVLEEVLKKYNIFSVKVLFMEVDRVKLIERLSKRKTCVKCQAVYHPDSEEAKNNICSVCDGLLAIRDDDNPEVVAKRFDEYIKKTADVKDYYESKGIMVKIDGDHSIEDVHKTIIEKFKV